MLSKAREIDESVDKFNQKQGAPSPQLTILKVNVIAKLVVDKANHMTYQYDDDGKFIKKFPNATGVETKRTDTELGIRYVFKIVKHPYPLNKVFRPKMAQNPNDYGPKAAILFMINPQNGAIEDNGQFIHGTKNPYSIGKSVSHGCVRLYNAISARLDEFLFSGDFILVMDSRKQSKK